MPRQARCSCGRIAPSDPALAFFEDRSAGTQNETCKNCRYHEVAHTRTDVRKNRFVCNNFEPMADGYPFDTYYCGHGGWD